MAGTTPLQIADALQGASRNALESVATLRAQTPETNATEFRKTLVDCEPSWMARSVLRGKVRAASDLGLYDLSRDANEQKAAVGHLGNALEAWKHYAAVRDGQYVPADHEWVCNGIQTVEE